MGVGIVYPAAVMAACTLGESPKSANVVVSKRHRLHLHTQGAPAASRDQEHWTRAQGDTCRKGQKPNGERWIKKAKKDQIDPLRSGTSGCSHTSARDARKTAHRSLRLAHNCRRGSAFSSNWHPQGTPPKANRGGAMPPLQICSAFAVTPRAATCRVCRQSTPPRIGATQNSQT